MYFLCFWCVVSVLLLTLDARVCFVAWRGLTYSRVFHPRELYLHGNTHKVNGMDLDSDSADDVHLLGHFHDAVREVHPVQGRGPSLPARLQVRATHTHTHTHTRHRQTPLVPPSPRTLAAPPPARTCGHTHARAGDVVTPFLMWTRGVPCRYRNVSQPSSFDLFVFDALMRDIGTGLWALGVACGWVRHRNMWNAIITCFQLLTFDQWFNIVNDLAKVAA